MDLKDNFKNKKLNFGIIIKNLGCINFKKQQNGKDVQKFYNN